MSLPMDSLIHQNIPHQNRKGNIKVIRADWIRVASDLLISKGIDHVKIQNIGKKLNVSRSSFYGYFNDQNDLHNALLDEWHNRNTVNLIAEASTPCATITEAVLRVFRCAVNPARFDIPMDFAVRDWARKSPAIARRVITSDTNRINALTAMFERYGYSLMEAETRGRVIYFMQTGYNDAVIKEDMIKRLTLVPYYVEIFTGKMASQSELEAFTDYVTSVNNV
jgi:AcrR family transcriptional regulator